MRHDSHYVEELSKPNKTFGKIISINLLEPNPAQPRVEIGSLDELSDSIKEKGILEPILVKPLHASGTYLIIAGERRWRAANLAGLREVPCIELDLDDQSVAEIALIENLQRKDLTLWEEADGLAALKQKFGYKHEDIAKKISKSRSTVTELLSVAGIPDQIRAKCRDQNIYSKSTLLEIARQFDENAMFEFLDRLKNKETEKPEPPVVAPTVLTPKQNPPATNFEKNRQTKFPASQENSEEAESVPQIADHTFYFQTADFDLQINFKSSGGYDKKNVLRALKQSFDEIKAN